MCRSPGTIKRVVDHPTSKPKAVISNDVTESPPKTTLPVPLVPEEFYTWLLFGTETTTPAPDKPDSSLLERSECVRKKFLSIGYRIIGGNEAERDQFPWHVAIYYKNNVDYAYQCGGTLITRKAVVTAAHCVTIKNTATSLPLDNFLIYMGLFSLSNEMGGEQVRKLSKVIVHPDYEPITTFYSDIAVLKFNDLIKHSEFVSPTCLFDNPIDETVNRVGLVPGWGYNGKGQLSENLTFIEMPIVPRKTCLNKHLEFYGPLLNGRTFCAGEASGKSVCNGDSGGGLVFSDDGLYWRIRGIVSLSIEKPGSFICDPNFYTVFTDVNQFLPWIRDHVI